jgi:hypothetical protein
MAVASHQQRAKQRELVEPEVVVRADHACRVARGKVNGRLDGPAPRNAARHAASTAEIFEDLSNLQAFARHFRAGAVPVDHTRIRCRLRNIC